MVARSRMSAIMIDILYWHVYCLIIIKDLKILINRSLLWEK